ncbi:hypothetical protein LVY72_10755 [Arthrobacter sp. I2-34]|uniref:Uncharacterized protein n=1 Tax=Arthrobacter hankyongi TaxID=2904801 RepID=A0ABS9L6T5_9MICC|nr:hypothetical protein [Arthrobacter hankyongi]MCG2622395.1 hypothetical protein [Arthrobacter hankyongi]
MGSFIWTLIIAAGAALIWRLSHRPGHMAGTGYTGTAAGPAQPSVSSGGRPAGATMMEAAARTDGAEAAEPEPIDGWTQSAADTAASEPPVEDQYIEDVAVAPHATPIDPGSEPSPWRIQPTAAIRPTAAGPDVAPTQTHARPAEGSPPTAEPDDAGAPAAPGALPQDILFDASEWAGDDGERLAEPGSGEGRPAGP